MIAPGLGVWHDFRGGGGLLCPGPQVPPPVLSLGTPQSHAQSSPGMWWKGVLFLPWQARQVRGSTEGLPTHTPVIVTKPLSSLPQHPENRLISAQDLSCLCPALHSTAPAQPLPAFCDLMWHCTSIRTHCQHKTELQLSTLSRSQASPRNGRTVGEFGPGQLCIQGENPD